MRPVSLHSTNLFLQGSTEPPSRLLVPRMCLSAGAVTCYPNQEAMTANSSGDVNRQHTLMLRIKSQCSMELQMKKNTVFLTLSVLSFLIGASSAQTSHESRTLVINDRSGKMALLKMGDKTYVDLKRLIQIAHGSITYEGNRIVVTMTCADTISSATATQAEPSSTTNLSHEFAKAAIEEISLLREWASTLANAIQNGYPVNDSWVANYRGQAQSGLAMASTATSTEADRDGLRLLRNEFESVQEWSNKLLDASKSMSAAKYAISPTELYNDPLSQKIMSCGHFLGQMMASGEFQDNPSCH